MKKGDVVYVEYTGPRFFDSVSYKESVHGFVTVVWEDPDEFNDIKVRHPFRNDFLRAARGYVHPLTQELAEAIIGDD